MRPVPLTLAFGFDPAEQQALVTALKPLVAPAERWVSLGGPEPAAAAGAAAGPAIGGCFCCSGSAALRVALVRLLRQGGADRIVLLAGPDAEAHRIADALRQPPLGDHLRLEHLVCVIGGASASQYLAPRTARLADLARDQLAAASAVFVRDEAGTDDARSIRFDAAARWLVPGAGSSTLPIPPGWRAWQAPAAAPSDGATGSREGLLLLRAWPGERIFDRRQAIAALDGLAALPGVAQAEWRCRTAREWYHWTCLPAASGPAGTPPAHSEAATAWRLDSRLRVDLLPGADDGPIAAAADRLGEALDR